LYDNYFTPYLFSVMETCSQAPSSLLSLAVRTSVIGTASEDKLGGAWEQD